MALVAAQLLPDHILACVLRRLAPRSLAASRCVCRTWCAVIDDCRLLRTDLLPLSLHGIFFMDDINSNLPEFFAHPLMGRKIAAKFDYVDRDDDADLYIQDHCNGLLLLWDRVVLNPATRQWARLPPPPPLCTGMEEFDDDMCLVYDPTVSPHYEVVFVPYVPPRFLLPQPTIFTEDLEWPPSPYTIRVFSSTTWSWEEKPLVRRGGAAGTIADMQSDRQQEHRYHVYWQGALYVQCQNGSILRITLSDGEYEVIKSPTWRDYYLGKSKGVCCASISSSSSCRLQIWWLTELCGKMEWNLKIDISLRQVAAEFSWITYDENSGPWVLHESNCDEHGKEALVDDKFEWNFNSGIVLEGEDKAVCGYDDGHIHFLGFHPYKEIVLLWVSRARVVLYDWSSSRVQDLGMLRLQSVGHSFSYTPCWT